MDSTCNWSIIFGIVLIALLITMIVMNHRNKYENFYDQFGENAASVNAPYTYRQTGTNSMMTNSIFGLVIVLIFLTILIMIITAPVSNEYSSIS